MLERLRRLVGADDDPYPRNRPKPLLIGAIVVIVLVGAFAFLMYVLAS